MTDSPPRGPYEGKAMVAPMVRVSTLGFRLACSREYQEGQRASQTNLPTNPPPVSCSPNDGTAFFTEEIISMKLMKTKREVRTYHVPLNLAPLGKDGSSLLPPGYLVPWAWAAQELLLSTTDKDRLPPGGCMEPLGLVFKGRGGPLGNATWEANHEGHAQVDAMIDVFGPPSSGLSPPVTSELVTSLFSPEAVEEEMCFVATQLLDVRRILMANNHYKADKAGDVQQPSPVEEVRGILRGITAAVTTNSSPPPLAPPLNTKVDERVLDIASITYGGVVALEDIAAIMKQLSHRRAERVRQHTQCPTVLRQLVTVPLIDTILVPIPVVEFATYDNFKNIIKRTPALQVLKKTILNPFPEGDYRSVDCRLDALCGLLGLKRNETGSKRVREEESGVVCSGGGGVGRVVCQLGAPNAFFAAKAAAVVCDDVDGLDLNSGCPKGFSADNNMGAALMSWPVLTGRILQGLNEGANSVDMVNRRRLDIDYIRQLVRLVVEPSHQLSSADGTNPSHQVVDRFHASYGLHCPVSLKTRLFDNVAESERHLVLAVVAAQGLIQNPVDAAAEGVATPSPNAIIPSPPIVVTTCPLPVPHALSLHCRLVDQRSDTPPLIELGSNVVDALRSISSVSACIVLPKEEEADTALLSSSNNSNNNTGRKLSKKDKKQQRRGGGGGPVTDHASLILEDSQVNLKIRHSTTNSTTAADDDDSDGVVYNPVDFRAISFVFNGSVVHGATSGPRPFFGTLIGRSCMWDPSAIRSSNTHTPRINFNTLLSNLDEVLCTVGTTNPPQPPLRPSRSLNYLTKWSSDLRRHAALHPITTTTSSSSSPHIGRSELTASDAAAAGITATDTDEMALVKLAKAVHSTLSHLGATYRTIALFYGAYRTQMSFFKYHLTRSFGEFPVSKIPIKELMELQLVAMQLSGCDNGGGGISGVMLDAAVASARVPVSSSSTTSAAEGGEGGGDQQQVDRVRTLSEALQYAKGPLELYLAIESCLTLALGVKEASSSSNQPLSVRYLLEVCAKEEVVTSQ